MKELKASPAETTPPSSMVVVGGLGGGEREREIKSEKMTKGGKGCPLSVKSPFNFLPTTFVHRLHHSTKK